MFCKFCGNEIDEHSAFCNVCGKRQDSQIDGVVSEASHTLNLNPTSIKLIVTNIILIMSYFLGWIKISGAEGRVAEFLAMLSGLEIRPISPQLVLHSFSYIKELASYASESVPIQYYLLYLFLIFPVLAAICIILILAKKQSIKTIGKLTAYISLACEAFAWYLVAQKEIGPTVWIFIFTATSIYFLITLKDFIGSELEKKQSEDSDEGMSVLEEAELAVMPEKMRKKLMKQYAPDANPKGETESTEEPLEFCFYCGAELSGNLNVCPSCGRKLK